MPDGQRIALVFVALHILTGAAVAEPAHDEPGGTQSFESCGLITGEYVTVLQLSARGMPPETLKNTLPDISPQAQRRVQALADLVSQEGLVESYSTIFSEYAGCARRVVNRSGKPTPGTREAHFYRCAGEAKVGYEVSLAAMVGGTESEVLTQVATPLKDQARTLFETFRADGAAAVFDQLSGALKRCLSKMP